MAYVISAYAISIGAVGLYRLYLARERRRLARGLGGGEGGPARDSG
jgi:hypothetical protein